MKHNQIFIHKVIYTFFIFVLMATVMLYADNNCSNLYKVTATQLNVRSQASTKGNVIGTLHNGDQVCINEESGNWGRTSAGWISKKHLVLLSNTNRNHAQSVSVPNASSSGDTTGLMVLVIVIVIGSIIFFTLKTLFYHTLISFGMAEADGRSKNGIRLTRLGKFLASISGLLLFLLFLFIGSLSK